MVLGIYALTTSVDDLRPRSRRLAVPGYSSVAEALMAFEGGHLALANPIRLRMRGVVPPTGHPLPAGWRPGDPWLVETTLGRALFNEALPGGHPYVNQRLDRTALTELVSALFRDFPTRKSWPRRYIKDLGFRWATRSGVTISFDDAVAPPKKAELMEEAYAERPPAGPVRRRPDHRRGAHAELIEIWTRTTDEVAEAMKEHFPATTRCS